MQHISEIWTPERGFDREMILLVAWDYYRFFRSRGMPGTFAYCKRLAWSNALLRRKAKREVAFLASPAGQPLARAIAAHVAAYGSD